MSTAPPHPQDQPAGPAAPPRAAPPPPPTAKPHRASNWMGITSLALSLAGLVTWFTAIPGIVLGHLSLAAVHRGEADNRDVGLAGLVTGYVVAVLGLVFWGLFVLALLTGIGWVISECGGDDPAAWCTDVGTSLSEAVEASF